MGRGYDVSPVSDEDRTWGCIIHEMVVLEQCGFYRDLLNGRKESKMTVGMARSSIRFGLRSVGLLVVFLAAMSLLACVAAIPVAVYYFETDKNYVAEADASSSADEVWAAIVRRGKQAEADGRAKIIDSNDTKRTMKITDGVQTANLKVLSLEENKSRVTIVASLPKSEEGQKEREKELALRLMKGLCEEAKAGCKFIKE